MDRADLLVSEMLNHWGEWIEMMPERDAINFLMNALAVTAVKERDKAEYYKTALNRCEISRK